MMLASFVEHLADLYGHIPDQAVLISLQNRVPHAMWNGHRGVSSAGRAPALQAGGHRFDPDTLHQVLDKIDEHVKQKYAYLSYLRQL